MLAILLAASLARAANKDLVVVTAPRNHTAETGEVPENIPVTLVDTNMFIGKVANGGSDTDCDNLSPR